MSRRYTHLMTSVADAIRAEDRRRLTSLTAGERVELALRLGDEDLETFRRARRLSREEGRRQLRLARQVGRVPSRCLTESL